MVAIELFAVGAFLVVLDIIAYARYRDARDKHLHLASESQSARAARMHRALRQDMEETTKELSSEELADLLEEPVPVGDADSLPHQEDAGELSVEIPGDGLVPATPLPSVEGEEGELVFLPTPPDQAATAAASPLHPTASQQALSEPGNPLSTLKNYQRRNEAELLLLRENLEALHAKLDSYAQQAPAATPAVASVIVRDTAGSLRTLKAKKDKLEGELSALQRRFMKREVDHATYEHLAAELHRELNSVHAQAMGLVKKPSSGRNKS